MAQPDRARLAEDLVLYLFGYRDAGRQALVDLELGFPGAIVRLNPGANPPATALAEIYEPPFPGYSPRGMDIDRNGVVWAPLASGHVLQAGGPPAGGDGLDELFGQALRAHLRHHVLTDVAAVSPFHSIFPSNSASLTLQSNFIHRVHCCGGEQASV